MCLAKPLKIKVINSKVGKLEDGREVRLDLVPEAKVGDYILAQADVATQILDKSQVRSIKSVIEKITAQ